MALLKSLSAARQHLAKYALLGLGALLLTGCAGGGGSLHVPPEFIEIGQPTTLTFEFSVWGSGSGQLSKRYTDRRCNYRIVGDKQFRSIPMRQVSETAERLTAQCTIPALNARPGDYLEYSYQMLFDGVLNEESEAPVPFRFAKAFQGSPAQ